MTIFTSFRVSKHGKNRLFLINGKCGFHLFYNIENGFCCLLSSGFKASWPVHMHDCMRIDKIERKYRLEKMFSLIFVQ